MMIEVAGRYLKTENIRNGWLQDDGEAAIEVFTSI